MGVEWDVPLDWAADRINTQLAGGEDLCQNDLLDLYAYGITEGYWEEGFFKLCDAVFECKIGYDSSYYFYCDEYGYCYDNYGFWDEYGYYYAYDDYGYDEYYDESYDVSAYSASAYADYCYNYDCNLYYDTFWWSCEGEQLSYTIWLYDPWDQECDDAASDTYSMYNPFITGDCMDVSEVFEPMGGAQVSMVVTVGPPGLTDT